MSMELFSIVSAVGVVSKQGVTVISLTTRNRCLEALSELTFSNECPGFSLHICIL
jgi:hypothetical protein